MERKSLNDQTRKDRRWLWGVFCLALIAVMSSLLLRSVEAEGPSLRGKPALEWLDALVETNALSADAITVFQEAGAEVVPFLSARSTWYSSLSKLASDAQEWFGPGSFMYRSIDGAAYPWRRMDVERRRAAVMVLGQLGTHAEASLPVLLKVLSEDYESGGYDSFRQSNAIIAMLHVAPASSEGASAVIRHLGSYSPNPGVAEAAFQSLKNLGPESREVFPSLITALRYRKQILYFSEVTRHNGNRGPAGMGNLLAMMQNTNAFVRESAAFGLYGMILVARDVINDPDDIVWQIQKQQRRLEQNQHRQHWISVG